MSGRAGVFLVATGCALLVGACGGGDVTSTSVTPSPTVTQPVVLDDRFEVEPGRKLHLTCVGSGPVTVLLEAGGGSGSEDWPAAITQPLSEKTRTCTYDRAGTGASDPPPERRRMMVDVNRDLDALLAAAGVEGRLLLVGTSFGGQAALDWALHHPARTAGLVVLDTDWPTGDLSRTLARFIPPKQLQEEMAGDRWNGPENVENIDYQATGAETEAAFRRLLGIPIRVVTATQSAECDSAAPACRRLRAAAVAQHEQWLRLSPTAVHVKVEAGHDLPNEATDRALREILLALAQAH